MSENRSVRLTESRNPCEPRGRAGQWSVQAGLHTRARPHLCGVSLAISFPQAASPPALAPGDGIPRESIGVTAMRCGPHRDRTMLCPGARKTSPSLFCLATRLPDKEKEARASLGVARWGQRAQVLEIGRPPPAVSVSPSGWPRRTPVTV